MLQAMNVDMNIISIMCIIPYNAYQTQTKLWINPVCKTIIYALTRINKVAPFTNMV